MSMRPIVSSTGPISYPCVRFLEAVVSPPVGKTEHHVKNSKDFVRYFNNSPQEELRCSPVHQFPCLIKDRLVNDVTLKGTHTIYFSSSFFVINQKPVPRTDFH